MKIITEEQFVDFASKNLLLRGLRYVGDGCISRERGWVTKLWAYIKISEPPFPFSVSFELRYQCPDRPGADTLGDLRITDGWHLNKVKSILSEWQDDEPKQWLQAREIVIVTKLPGGELVESDDNRELLAHLGQIRMDLAHKIFSLKLKDSSMCNPTYWLPTFERLNVLLEELIKTQTRVV